MAAALEGGVPIVCSSHVSPEFREYERTVTTVADAYLLKPCRAYLELLAPIAQEVLVLTSAGGLVPLEQAAARPVSLLLSGPAGGVLAASAAAEAAGLPDCVTFDMGGTSTDVCLIRSGRPRTGGAAFGGRAAHTHAGARRPHHRCRRWFDRPHRPGWGPGRRPAERRRRARAGLLRAGRNRPYGHRRRPGRRAYPGGRAGRSRPAGRGRRPAGPGGGPG